MTSCFIHKKINLVFLLYAISIFNGNSFHGQINEEYNISNEVWDSFKLKNAKESRLIEFKDNDEQLLAKLVLLELINKHRKNTINNLLSWIFTLVVLLIKRLKMRL
ncbi:MAG: hypothetical protein CM15mP65_00330 [Crocinitomicaceae bacterium]|nr:MAG: hypothetical protein CM15mP65_00330 [Crocinitomicaceae bacterium]